MTTEMEDEFGNLYTQGRKKVPLVKDKGQEYQCTYKAQMIDVILAKNFNLGGHGRIPSSVFGG